MKVQVLMLLITLCSASVLADWESPAAASERALNQAMQEQYDRHQRYNDEAAARLRQPQQTCRTQYFRNAFTGNLEATTVCD